MRDTDTVRGSRGDDSDDRNSYCKRQERFCDQSYEIHVYFNQQEMGFDQSHDRHSDCERQERGCY